MTVNDPNLKDSLLEDQDAEPDYIEPNDPLIIEKCKLPSPKDSFVKLWIELTRKCSHLSRHCFSKDDMEDIYEDCIRKGGWISFIREYFDEGQINQRTFQLRIFYNYLNKTEYSLEGIYPKRRSDSSRWRNFRRRDLFLLETMRRNKMVPRKIFGRNQNKFCLDFEPQIIPPKHYPIFSSIADMGTAFDLNTTGMPPKDKTLEKIAGYIPDIYISVPPVLKNLIIDINTRETTTGNSGNYTHTVSEVINAVVEKIDAVWEWKRLFRFRESPRIWSEIQILPKENFVEKYTCCDDLN